MIAADLHCHSTWSDGSATFGQLTALAKDSGLSAISVADHDTLAGFMREEWQHTGITVVPGIEISAYDYRRGRKVHILGYGMQKFSLLEETCMPFLARRHETALKMVATIRSAGYEIREEDALKYAGPAGTLYRQHIMRALMDKGYTEAIYGPLYKELFGRGGKAQLRIDYMDMRDAVHAVRESGGRAFLAHAFLYDSAEALPELINTGLSGIEQVYPTHTIAQRQICAEIAECYGLGVSGGTDFHGLYGERQDMPGDFGLGRAELRRFLECVE